MRRLPRVFDQFRTPSFSAGRAALITVLTGALITVTTGWAYIQLTPHAIASTVSTSLTVLNTPPNWTVDAQESTESSTSTPTNAGSLLSFVGTATDSSNDNYWLLVCSTGAGATPHNNAPPTCVSGTMWARSATTTSGTQATASTTTIPTAPFQNESNNWFAYICDGNSTGAQCNSQIDQGSGTTASPFVINHPPSFTLVTNNSPQNPGSSLTWNATASDADTIRGGDTVKLYVCKANDFSATTPGCGAGGTWAASSFVSSNPSTSTALTIPFQDGNYAAFVFVTDQNNLVATGNVEGTSSPFAVNNVAPTISAATVSVGTTSGDIILVQPHATSGPYKVSFVVNDNNGCQNHSGGHEIASATTTIYRSGIGSAACQTTENTNSCYPSADPQTQIVCTQDPTVNACNGPSDSDVGWSCTFNLWYNADPTDAGSQFSGQKWDADVQATDDNGALSAAATSLTGNTLDSFLAYNVSTTSIAYGGLQPGQSNDPLSPTTDLQEWGNTGLDEDLYGDTMCTTWTSPDSCDAGGADPTRKIPVANQHFATSSVAYASGSLLTSSTSPSLLGIHVLKTVATTSVQTKNTWWGILVPGTITVSGNYTGQDSIIAVKSNSSFW